MQLAEPLGPGQQVAQDDQEAVRANGLIFVSGQAGIDKAGRTVAPGDLEAQGRQAFANLAAVLAEAGAELSDMSRSRSW